jgi:tripartite-type tricarboxylate transporter receptor subunit TctC
VLALLSGQVTPCRPGPASVAQHVKAGKLRVLAHWGNEPLAAFPGVPSLKEAGHPVEFAQWSGLFVPARRRSRSSPNCARRRVRRPTIRRCVRSITAAGSPLQYLDTPEFQAYIAEDSKKLKDAVQKIGRVE